MKDEWRLTKWPDGHRCEKRYIDGQYTGEFRNVKDTPRMVVFCPRAGRVTRQTIAAALIGAAFGLAFAAPGFCKDTFEAKEIELKGFDLRQDEVLLTMTKPLYRLGEVLKMNDGRYVVPINYFFQRGEWHYLVVEVKVGKQPTRKETN